MKVGVVVPMAEGDGDAPGSPTWPSIRSFARRAEAAALERLAEGVEAYRARAGALVGRWA